MIILTMDHITLNSCEAVKQICAPLFKSSKITYFTYLRYFNDHHRIYLTSNVEWVDYFFKNDLYLYPYMSKPFDEYQDGYISWNYNQNDPVASSGLKYDIDKRFTVVKKFDDYIEFYGFGVPTNVDVDNNYYLQNIQFFEKFILYFKTKAIKLIEMYEKDKIYVPPEKFILQNRSSQYSLVENIPKEFNIDRLLIDENILLGRKEVDSIKLLLKGYTIKKIASILKKSPRTVESQIESVRLKLKCCSKNQLISKLLKIEKLLQSF